MCNDLQRSERGNALVEFSFLVPVLLVLFLGVFDFGIAIQESMVINAAARAGAEYGSTEGNASDTAGMQSAALNAAKAISTLAVTPSTWCTCSPGGTTVSCSSTCATYDVPIQYVQVQTIATIPVLFRFMNLPVSFQLKGNSILRAR